MTLSGFYGVAGTREKSQPNMLFGATKMNLQSLPKLNSRPQLSSAKEGHKFAQASRTESLVSDAFANLGEQLASFDGSDIDFDREPGSVVVVDRSLDVGYDVGKKFSSAELKYDVESGKPTTFTAIKDDQNFVSFEYKQYDESRSSNPTFTSVVNGEKTEFDMNPNTGSITAFRE